MANGAALTLGPVRLVARWSLRSADHAGRFTFLLIDMLRGLAEWRIYLPRTFEQSLAVGYGSLFIVLLVAGFAGAVTSLQTGYQFTGAHDVRERHRDPSRLSHRQGLARPHLRRLRVRRAILLPAARPVVLARQELRLRVRRHPHPLLRRVQRAAGRGGGRPGHHGRGGEIGRAHV